jgi:hypothetical protein
VPDLFGPVFVATNLEQAMIATLKLWLPVYIPEIETLEGRPNGIPAPRSYTTRREFDKFYEDQLPTVVVVSPGLDKNPVKEGDGTYRATWRLHVACVVSTSDQVQTGEVAKIMGTAIRMSVLQHASLGGVACGMDWYDESYDDLPNDDVSRFLGASTLSFRVEVDQVINPRMGPDASYLPDPGATTPPGSNWPEADTVTVKIEKEAL